MKSFFPIPRTLSVVFLSTALMAEAQDAPIIIDPPSGMKLIPISISGFTGEAAAVLKFDLEVQGFKVVGANDADYNLTGQNAAQVEGRLVDRIAQTTLFARAYTGSSLRAQAHRLSDDVVLAITKKPGIALTKIAFRVERGNTSEIVVADYDGFNPVAITEDGSRVASPAWVPRERKLLYTSYKSGFPFILAHDLSSGQRPVFARHPGSNLTPAVSPDGRRVAMILSKDGSPDLYVCNIDGSELKRLTATRADESSPCWSPDGRTICFVSREGGRAQLYTIPATGGQMRRLNHTNAGNATEPDWSPDGKQIIFTTMRRDFELCVIPSSGGVAETLVPGEDASWASNSRTVVFTRRQGNKRILSLLDVPTKHVKDVRQISGSCSQPSWAK